MRGGRILNGVFFLLASVGSHLGAQGEPFPNGVSGVMYYAPRIDLVGLSIQLDGSLEEEAWVRAAWQGLNGFLETAPEGPGDLGARWAVLTDTGFLYVAVEMTDSVRRTGEDTLCMVWQDDSFEVYIDALNDGPDCLGQGASCYGRDDAQITVGRDNTGKSDPNQLAIGGNAGKGSCDFTGPAPEVCRGIAVETAAGWRAEIAIPLVTLGNLNAGTPDGTPTWTIVPDHGCRIGWSFKVCDDDDGGGRDTIGVWALVELGGDSAWYNPGSFGKLVFIDPRLPLPRDPVRKLTCTRNSNGTVALSWENPPGASAADTTVILVDGVQAATVPGDATSAILTEAQVPWDDENHTIKVDNGACPPASCFLYQSSFDTCGAIRRWNILGAYGPSSAAPGEAAMRLDYMTDGVDTEDEFKWQPGATIETDLGVTAASTTYNDGIGSLPTVQSIENAAGYVNFLDLFTGQVNVMAYAQCYVVNETSDPMEVYWADSSDDSIQVKLNGTEVWIKNLGREGLTSCALFTFPLDKSPDGVLFVDPLVLNPGYNTLLVKVFNGCCDWNFIGRFQDASGLPVTEGLRISLTPSGAVPPVRGLTCTRQADGSVVLEWSNPPEADPSKPILFQVDGVDLATTVPGSATTATLSEPQVPRDGLDHVVKVINSGDASAPCTVARDRAFAPPELQTVGGKLYVNAGGPDVQDAVGRVWKADEVYLAPNQPAGNTADAGDRTFDTTLLEDPDVPGRVLAQERWCECTIHYQMGVPNGRYEVTLLFAETCETCVSAALGGTNTSASANRIMDLEVEDKKVEAFSQADEALPPPGDGVGKIFTATSLFFDVAVADGLLDIRVLDRGPGNPPENPRIKGFYVECTGAGVGPFIRGDCNGDGAVTGQVTDAVFLLNYNFLGGQAPPCSAACDVNGDSAWTGQVTDAVYLLNYNFLGGTPPPAPYPGCGLSTKESDQTLGCATPTPAGTCP